MTLAFVSNSEDTRQVSIITLDEPVREYHACILRFTLESTNCYPRCFYLMFAYNNL